MTDTSPAERRRANLIGLTAIASWAILALLTVGTEGIPPFQTAAIAFAVGALVGATWRLLNGLPDKQDANEVPLKALAFSSLGLFAYHALYFSALKSAPAAEASLIAYLWPVLIVVGSALLPGEKLRWYHLVGALCGLIGCGLLVGGSGELAFSSEGLWGYMLALAAAFTWASYSLGSRLFAKVPTQMVAISCAVAAALSAIIALIFEPVVWILSPLQWLSLIGLGLLPLGGAFYTWDYGMKFGDIQWLGTASYAAPLLSTIILVLTGTASATMALALACLLIVGGAFLASGALSSRNKRLTSKTAGG
ncbi:MAG: EamA family transporter [Pseudomonadota bacterium]